MNSFSSTNNHYIRVLPSGETQIWVSVDRSSAEYAEHAHTSVCVCEKCKVHTVWMPLEKTAAHAWLMPTLAAFPYQEGPCRCLIVQTKTEGSGSVEACVLLKPIEARLGDLNQKPFMCRFSWTVGLPWTPPGVTAEVSEGKTIVSENGKRVATLPRANVEEALREYQVAMY